MSLCTISKSNNAIAGLKTQSFHTENGKQKVENENAASRETELLIDLQNKR